MTLRDLGTMPPDGSDKNSTKEETERLLEQLRDQQKKLFAQKKYSLLVVLQGLDASGKDGAINDVFSHLNLFGVRVIGFKAPSEEEKGYDFLWRVHRQVPPRGMIHVFNRSHYEDVLVPKVEGWVSPEIIEQRYRHIEAFEQLLADHGTSIVKLYLHKSRQAQLEDLEERLTRPEKHWKHNDGDWKALPKRDAYLEAYEALMKRCSGVAPWHIVPADKNWYKSHLVARHVTDALAKLPLAYPALEKKR